MERVPETQRSPESAKEKYVIVDIGSGLHPYISDPAFPAELRERFENDDSLEYVGIDSSMGALQSGRAEFLSRSQQHGLDKTGRVHFVLVSEKKGLPFAKGSVSEVILRNVLGSADAKNVRGMANEISRILKTGGTVKIMEEYPPFNIARGRLPLFTDKKEMEVTRSTPPAEPAKEKSLLVYLRKK